MGVGKGRNGGELAKEDIRQKETEDEGGIGEKGGGKVESIEGSGRGRWEWGREMEVGVGGSVGREMTEGERQRI